MALETIKLIAPNSLEIAGIKLKDNSLVKVIAKYDVGAKAWLYEMPDETIRKMISPTILVDIEGKEWKAHDVEFHSLTKGVFL
ncbi:MAG TPA: hypothetical protein ENJ28_09365 [Gammaproteobacteria bacterium]|nr:hypothetical protein [Gammaproteobacteria bacterium]